MFTKGSGEVNTLTAGAPLEKRRLVKFMVGSTVTPPEVVYTAGGEEPIGVSEYKVVAGEWVAVRPIKDTGIFEMVAADTFAVNANLYAADDGKVSAAAVGSVVGVAREQSIHAGQVVSVVTNL